MRALFASAALALLSLCCMTVPVPAAEPVTAPEAADKPSAEEQIRGEWVLYRDTPKGRYMTIKEHLGSHTVVTTYDPNNQPIQVHRSEYRVDASGPVPIFRYRNRVVLIGPDAGAKDDRDRAYLFRIEGDRFYEAHGMLPGDTGQPSLIVWERLKNNPIPRPST